MDPGDTIALMTVFGCGTYILSSGIRAWVKRAELKHGRATQQPQLPSNLEERLERIEQAVDSLSIEVERISEGQRFTTKLLAGLNGAPAQSQGQSSALPPGDRGAGSR